MREALPTTALQCIMDRGLIHSAASRSCAERWASPRASSLHLLSLEGRAGIEALRYQQPKLLQYARQLMEDPAPSWREGVRPFGDLCLWRKRGSLCCPLGEEKETTLPLSGKASRPSREDQTKLFRELMIFGLPRAKRGTPGCWQSGTVHDDDLQSFLNTMPFLFPEVAEDMVEFRSPLC